jgi:radical SAM protein with 4Fe4S-binding SPASM domain
MREIIDGLRFAPRTCTWELTLRCNLNCGHCGSRAGRARPGEMDKATALRVVGELAAMGCVKTSLSGGEPTLSPYWEDVVREGTRLGIHTNMITNGMTTGRDFVQRAKDAGLRGLGVSLDGLEPHHDANRRHPGLFRRVMGLIDDCNAVGLPVGAITTIWNENFHDLEAMHDLLAGRVYVWQLQLGAKMGNLEDHAHQQVEPEDLLTIVPEVARIIRKGKVRIHVADNLGYYGPYEEVLRTRRSTPVSCWVGCYAGCRHLGIEADGGVKGCLSIQSTRATEGNLQQASLRDIWWRPGAFAYNRQFQLDDLAGFCRTCEHASICRGGCLSMRTCEGGRDNPFCYHRVATLAERRASRRARYVPMAIAPAAILAAFGLGCGGSTEEPKQQDASTSDVVSGDADPDAASYYGMPEDAGDGGPDPDSASYYGMPEDAEPDVDAASWYGMPGDAYGIPDADPDAASYYGMPEDAGDAGPGPDAGSFYGMPEDSGTD